ncbi:hypothetical protein [Streptomyces sp. NPDC059850]|uniref:hypothetical protein n=1 Tax=Streptomyces sp. NPDC059850 TaxID=3346970 RepID=UPI00366543FE
MRGTARPNAYRWRDAMGRCAPVARTVEDAALALGLMSGEHPGDPYSFPVLDSFADGLRSPSLTGAFVSVVATVLIRRSPRHSYSERFERT